MKKLMLIVFLFAGYNLMAQDPVVTARFFNPRFDCATQIYRVDAQFRCDVPNQRIFGVNVRFFYDNHFLEFTSIEGLLSGYYNPGFPPPQEGIPGSGIPFGMTGTAEYVNGNVYLSDPLQIHYLNGSGVTLFTACFHVIDPNSVNIQEFCPSLIWDLEANPSDGGFGDYSEGLVVTLADPNVVGNSIPSTENVLQFNWIYGPEGEFFGHPVPVICIPTICWTVPVSNWALFLGLGLMIIASVFIYKRRLNT